MSIAISPLPAQQAITEIQSEVMLVHLCEVACMALAADGIMITLMPDGNSDRVATFPTVTGLPTDVQRLLQTGPGMRAVAAADTVIIGDLTTSECWPALALAAAPAGIRAVVAVPLISRGGCSGILVGYRSHPGSWSDEHLSAAQIIADVAASYMADMADRGVLEDALRRRAQLFRSDVLTGLPNRVELFALSERALVAARHSGTATAVVVLNLDGFKMINDAFGYTGGDLVLGEVARRLVNALRSHDTLARFDGDEFVCLCEEFSARPDRLLKDVTSVIRRLRRVFDTPVLVGDSEIVVSASFGVSINGGVSDGEDVVADAERAMYVAKGQGRGGIVVNDRTRSDELANPGQLRRDLFEALANGQLRVYYQPIVAADDVESVEAVEALLRWQRSDGSLLAAAAFIDFAVSSGLIGGFGRWLIDQTCAQLRLWVDEFGARAPRVVYLNMSAGELADPALPRLLTAAVTKHGLTAAQVGLEIVEDNLADPDIAIRLRRLRDRGHPLSVDDFGTGFSSLARLIDLPVDVIKIDRSFVVGVPADTRRVGVINAILSIAEALNIDTIAEGVETPEQQHHLTAAGARFLQGYHTGRPQIAADITSYLTGQLARNNASA